MNGTKYESIVKKKKKKKQKKTPGAGHLTRILKNGFVAFSYYLTAGEEWSLNSFSLNKEIRIESNNLIALMLPNCCVKPILRVAKHLPTVWLSSIFPHHQNPLK